METSLFIPTSSLLNKKFAFYGRIFYLEWTPGPSQETIFAIICTYRMEQNDNEPRKRKSETLCFYNL